MDDLSELARILFNYINNSYYQKSKANYCYIESVEIGYDNNQALEYNINIDWGRYYPEDNEKFHLNESRSSVINVDPKYIDNYEVILGQFIESIKESR